MEYRWNMPDLLNSSNDFLEKRIQSISDIKLVPMEAMLGIWGETCVISDSLSMVRQ